MPRPKPQGDDALQAISVQLRTGVLNKLDYITWFDRKQSRRAVLEDSLTDLIAKWEKKNGPITGDQIAEMKKALGQDT